jgi:hypothetical protein
MLKCIGAFEFEKRVSTDKTITGSDPKLPESSGPDLENRYFLTRKQCK